MNNSACIIIEPRVLDILPFVFNVFASETKWPIVWFHGNTNKEFAEEIKSKSNFELILINLNTNNLTVVDYSNILLSTQFWEHVHFENVLIFQWDTMLTGFISIDDMMKECSEYDYVGAPWGHTGEDTDLFAQVGNGGLSFRKKSAMLKLSKLIIGNKHPEDLQIYKHRHHIKIAPFDIAKKFSVEMILFHEKPFGIHKPWPYLSTYELEQLSKSNHVQQFFKFLKINEPQ